MGGGDKEANDWDGWLIDRLGRLVVAVVVGLRRQGCLDFEDYH